MADFPEEIQDDENYFIAMCEEDKTINIITMNSVFKEKGYE